jgi:hypothetical protein
MRYTTEQPHTHHHHRKNAKLEMVVASHYEHNHQQRTKTTFPWKVQCANKSTQERVERQ